MRRAIISSGLLLVLGCSASQGPGRDFRSVRALIDRTLENHPDIVWLTLHAVPTGQTRCRIVGCNSEEEIGKLSATEDIETMQTKSVTILPEDKVITVIAPILDKSGNAVAAAGITLKRSDSTSEESLVNQARSIAREMAKDIREKDQPMW
jgi:hypothetical protein